MTLTQESASWNMAQQYYDMLQAFMSFETQAYAENDIRELWKWVSWLYDNIYLALGEKEKEDMDKIYDTIEKDIYASPEGDKLNDLYSDQEGDIEEYRRQMKQIRHFRRKILNTMQKKGMILPWNEGRDLGKAGISMGDV